MKVSAAGAVLAALGLVAALSGCTVNGPDPERTERERQAGPDLPQRPGELPVAGKRRADICGWLTAADKASIPVGEISGRPLDSDGANYAGCGFLGHDGNADYGIGIRVVPEPIERFLQQINSNPDSRRTYRLNGHGAVQSQVWGAENLGCDAFVDAAEGQTLWINLMLFTPGGLDTDQMCGKAQLAAEAVVSTLQSQR
ncbi:hypothetical protein GCM10009854_39230 [Saccharopolyspora halophila]|uniref:DUF3558 domain-containing protein n=1 Tax=Saccharopolyspora halophila TaxID=405551 RepID=A0ABP5TMV9_9PSEU